MLGKKRETRKPARSDQASCMPRGRPAGSRNARHGVPGVVKAGHRWRVRFRNAGKDFSYGTFATLEGARKAAQAVVEYRQLHGVLPRLDDARLRRVAPRVDCRTGVKGVQAYRGGYRLRLRVDGKLRYFGQFATLDEARARSVEVQRARSRGDDPQAV